MAVEKSEKPMSIDLPLKDDLDVSDLNLPDQLDDIISAESRPSATPVTDLNQIG